MPTMRSYLEVTHQAQGSQEEEEELYNYYMLLLQYITIYYNILQLYTTHFNLKHDQDNARQDPVLPHPPRFCCVAQVVLLRTGSAQCHSVHCLQMGRVGLYTGNHKGIL
jgi:hypothetical protein